MSQSRLFLIDGHAHLFKAFYAIRELSNSSGMPTNMLFGFTQMLTRLLKDFEPEHLVVLFDSPGKTFRSEIYQEYKANREAPPEDFSLQLPHIFKLLDAFGIARIAQPGMEADDLIATLCARSEELGFDKVTVVSSDKDLFQLVTDRVDIAHVKPERIELFDAGKVVEKMGVPPERILDYQGLVGDSVDNIPGIPKVGPKTAVKLLDQFGDLDTTLERADEITAKALRARVQEFAEQARLSRELARLKQDVPLDVAPDSFARREEDKEKLAELFHMFEFAQFTRQYPLSKSQRAEMKAREDAKFGSLDTSKYAIADTSEKLREWAARWAECGWLAFDTETDSDDPMNASLVGMSLCGAPGEAVYVPIGHADLIAEQVKEEEAAEILGPLFAAAWPKLTAHHYKYDLKVLRAHGFPEFAVDFDTMLAAYIVDPEARLNLKQVARERLGVVMTEISELIGSGKNQTSMSDTAIPEAAKYAGQDADATLRLTQKLLPEIDESPAREFFYNVELPLSAIIDRMERQGVAIDTRKLKDLGVEFQKDLESLAGKIYDIVGRAFAINSPKQVSEVLFEELELPTKGVKRGKTGVYSTDEATLDSLKSAHPLPALLLEYRGFDKLKSTYVDTLPSMRDPRTKRVHTQFNQTGAATGRLSSNGPNLQNIPVRTAHGRRIRNAFVPCREGNVLLAADYSQIELRVLAHMTGDPDLLQAFRDGIDIHSLTASKIFGTEPGDESKEMRSRAKTINFGILYGMSAFRLSNELEIPRNEAQAMIDGYFAAYPKVKEWIDATIAFAKEHGYVETIAKRRRKVKDINSRNFNARGGAERIAANTPIQGSAADLIKTAMVDIDRHLAERRCECKMILQVHDELIFDLPQTEVAALQPEIVFLMEAAIPLDAPVQVDVAVGQAWDEV